MATTITGINQTKVISNLDTYNHTALLTSLYSVSLQLTEIPPSGCTITIKQNGTTIVSTSAPAVTQAQVNLGTLLSCTASDTVSVVVASSTASDKGLNAIKGILKISPGPVQ